MKFSRKLQQGLFLKRYKRFFADIEFKDQTLIAHVPNTGSMKGVNIPGQICLFSESDNPERKLKFTLEMIQVPSGAWVGVNTATPNMVMKEVLIAAVGSQKDGRFSHWEKFDEVKPEYKINKESRLDFALKKKGQESFHFIEVKNVTLAEEAIAKFPDSVSERGQKHLRELMLLMEQGHTAELVFFIQREDCTHFAPADDIDPVYGQLLREAIDKGLRVTPVVASLSAEGVELDGRVLPLNPLH